ncbi:DUF202 domain-containing protein [Gordonia sp. HNM0687]|uniref:DUF202 domain-containing protein n=1 Tax=Gordonia mangrovi TaxID=2665643 RepID=A0A6L7GKL4_9ACTN|nr:DUF202 domain-containing protein [Gordonia mangrovi]MXP20023.1 DUF202 domain-containing protein [Gordonia mangrovi]UVF79361.1 DUF202 domain-containing protein [Gordonia mangrovi]
MVSDTQRWPKWVYRDSDEPDYRFTLANERTFLAWIRTALAMVAAGVAVNAFDLGIPRAVQHLMAAALVFLGILCAGASWSRWARAEYALRRGRPLPASWTSAILAAAIVVLGLILLVVL